MPQIETIAHVPLSEELETIKDQASLKTKAEELQHPGQTVRLAGITPNDNTEILPFLKGL